MNPAEGDKMKTSRTSRRNEIERFNLNRLTPLKRIAMVLALTASSIATRASLVAHWTFDETSGTIAHDSAGSYNGNLSPAGAAFVSGGISGNATSPNKA